jgi:hypothetical protein
LVRDLSGIVVFKNLGHPRTSTSVVGKHIGLIGRLRRYADPNIEMTTADSVDAYLPSRVP